VACASSGTPQGPAPLWIAAGNEALPYTQATGQPVRADRTWANLYDLRNYK
jgi:hypothetical protein